MNLNRQVRQVWFSVSLVVGGLLFSGSAMASHMRAAIMKDASITAAGLVTGTLQTAWAKGSMNSSENINVYALADTARATSLGVVTTNNTLTDTSDPAFDVATAPIALNFGASGLNLTQGTYILRRDSCCRIGGIINGAPSNLAAEAAIVWNGAANSSPVFNSTPYARVALGLPFSFYINASDPDNTALTYTLLVNQSFPEYGAPPVSGLTLNPSTGQLTMSAVDTALLVNGGTYAVKVRATDGSGAYSDWDILLIALTSSNVPPVIATPAGGANQTVAVGQTLSLNISATDPDGTQNVTLQAQGLPANATFTPGAPTNPTSGTLTFSPQAGQVGQTFSFNLVATDNDQTFPLSSTLNMQLTVAAAGAVPIPTLSEWGLMILSGLMVLGTLVVRRRRPM